MFKTNDGLNLFEQCWLPQAGHKAAVVLVHGYAEHSSRYIDLAAHLNQQGYAVYAFDLRGHGRSEGMRTFISSFFEYTEDLYCFLAEVIDKEEGKPIFVFGHSMGATIAVYFMIKYQLKINGLILSSPFFKIPNRSFLLYLFVMIAGALYPELPMFKRLDSRFISHDLGVVQDYNNDPLVYHGRIRLGLTGQLKLATKFINKHLESIALPLLILHGREDLIADVEASRQFYNLVGSKDKTLKLYQNLYHDILHEQSKEIIYNDIISWLGAHL